MTELKTFKDLVSWCTWRIVQDITSGERLGKTVSDILQYAREWEPQEITRTEEERLQQDFQAMLSAHSLCPADMPHLDRMRWMAKEFRKRTSA